MRRLVEHERLQIRLPEMPVRSQCVRIPRITTKDRQSVRLHSLSGLA